MAQSKKEFGTMKYQGEGYAVGDYHVPKPVIDAMRVVSDWMYGYLFVNRSYDYYSSEYLKMFDCRDYMEFFLNSAKEE